MIKMTNGKVKQDHKVMKQITVIEVSNSRPLFHLSTILNRLIDHSVAVRSRARARYLKARDTKFTKAQMNPRAQVSTCQPRHQATMSLTRVRLKALKSVSVKTERNNRNARKTRKIGSQRKLKNAPAAPKLISPQICSRGRNPQLLSPFSLMDGVIVFLREMEVPQPDILALPVE